MKKLFAIAALVAVMVACNDSKKSGDETNVTGDSLTNAANEAAAAIDSAMMADSLKNAADSLKK